MYKNLTYIAFLAFVFFGQYSYSNTSKCSGVLGENIIVIDDVSFGLFRNLPLEIREGVTVEGRFAAIPFQIQQEDNIIFIVRDEHGKIVDKVLLVVRFYEKEIAGRKIPLRIPSVFVGKNIPALFDDLSLWMQQKGIESTYRRNSVIELPYSTTEEFEVILTTDPRTLDPRESGIIVEPTIGMAIRNGEIEITQDYSNYIRN